MDAAGASPQTTYPEAERRIAEALLSNARSLDLKGLNLKCLPESLFELTHLQELYLSLNQLTRLPESIGALTQLQQLYLSLNQLTGLPESIGALTQLQELDVSGNKLGLLPAWIGALTSLRELDVSGNELINLPESIGALGRLRELNLSDNKLSALPRSITHLTALARLFLHDNPGLALAPEALGPSREDVWRQKLTPVNPADILEYYFASRQSRPLNEAKMILVGRGGVGKTSVVARLVRNEFNAEETKTEGIAITPWSIQVGMDHVRLNIWDFGGQEIMHATHQFFFTKRSLYVLVINAREGDQDGNIEYWLRLIESFGGESPVIVVINKIKDHAFDLNRRGLRDKFPAIREFIQTDCKADVGIAQLRRSIAREIDHMAHVRDPFPANWFSIKDRLANLRENFISYEQYQALCAEHGLSEESSQSTLVGFLHDLGIVVNFREHTRLRDTHVLNPRWVTSGIYRILNAQSFAQRKTGEIDVNELATLLDPTEYPRNKHQYLFDLMEKFELCYEYYEHSGRYLVPEILTKEEPVVAEFADPHALRFEYRYNILPDGVLPRYIVRARALNEHLPRWKTGVVLKFEGNRALVKADIQDRTVKITVLGDNRGRRRLLSIIRSDFGEIHRSIAKLQVDELVPIPGLARVLIPYGNLLAFEKHDIEEMKEVVDGKIVSINVKELLDGVEEPAARSVELGRESLHAARETMQVVFSYSRKDENLRDQLETQLKLLERNGVIKMWYDRKILSGENWAGVIDDNFKQADIILLLVSVDFIASSYCYEIEMKTVLERHKKGEATVIPIILRHCKWQNTPFGSLQALPKDGKPVTAWDDRDEAWMSVADGIEKAVEAARSRTR